MRTIKYLILIVLGASSCQFSTREGGSCSVPVFRYALERWKPDAYKAIYIHRGELKKEEKELLQRLEDAALNSDVPLNLLIQPVDTNTFSKEKLRDVLKGRAPEKLPALAIWYPEQLGKKAPLSIIEPNAANLKALIASPKRKELAERLIKGESVVWIFIPSGNAEKDERAKALIRHELDLSLKDLAKMGFFTTAGTTEKKLTYSFPILTLSRSDAEERFFLEMLMKSEPDLYEHQEEPMVFPVFGRGRVLGCLFGKYISEDKVRDAITFLAASCSCEVKAMNPGVDLLIPAQWDRVLLGALYADEDDTLPELTGIMPGIASSLKNGEIAEVREPGKSKSLITISGIAVSSLLVVVVFASVVLSYRRKKN